MTKGNSKTGDNTPGNTPKRKLEGGSTGNFPKRVFWIFYDPKKTDLSEADFVNAEKERLGVTADDRLVIWLSVTPIHARNVLPI